MMRFFRRFKDLQIEGPQAKAYDETTRQYRMQEIKQEAQEIARHIHPGDSVLEVAAGPGYLSIELAKSGMYRITGIELSHDFVAIARQNAKRANAEVDFAQGNASALPFRDETFHFIVCVLSFKNFREPLIVLNEMHRVLKPGGTALIMDLNRHASKEKVKAFVKSFGFKGFSAFLVRLMQTSGAYTRKEYEDFIAGTPFRTSEITDTGMGFSVYLRK
jgi:ubiquinone/menaquinone biosynthesis C-methylase UbiE